MQTSISGGLAGVLRFRWHSPAVFSRPLRDHSTQDVNRRASCSGREGLSRTLPDLNTAIIILLKAVSQYSYDVTLLV
jgi:hypothetical protein